MDLLQTQAQGAVEVDAEAKTRTVWQIRGISVFERERGKGADLILSLVVWYGFGYAALVE